MGPAIPPAAAAMLRATYLVGVVVAAGCSSSASLAREGSFPAACREARDETPDEQRVLRERLVAEVAPRLAIEMVQGTASSDLEKLVGNRYPSPRFARVRLEIERVDFEARIQLEEVRDRHAYYRVGYINEYLAADLVSPRPEGDLATLGIVAGALAKATVDVSLLSLCATAGADPGCMGWWAESDRDAARRRLESVDADPELRRRKDQLLAAARGGHPLVVLVPNPTGRLDAPVVRLRLLLRTRFGASDVRCSHQQRVMVELSGNDIDEVATRELSGRPRPLQSLRPTLEWAAPDDASQD